MDGSTQGLYSINSNLPIQKPEIKLLPSLCEPRIVFVPGAFAGVHEILGEPAKETRVFEPHNGLSCFMILGIFVIDHFEQSIEAGRFNPGIGWALIGLF